MERVEISRLLGGGILKGAGIAIGMVVEPTIGGCPWRRTDNAQGGYRARAA